MLTGVKTKSSVLGLNAAVTPGQCDGAAGNELKTVLEESHDAGMYENLIIFIFVAYYIIPDILLSIN